MTRTPLSKSKGQRPRSPGHFTHRGVYASGSCSDDRGNVFAVGTYCYVAVRRGRLGDARRFGAHRASRGAGHIVAALAQLVNKLLFFYMVLWTLRTASCLKRYVAMLNSSAQAAQRTKLWTGACNVLRPYYTHVSYRRHMCCGNNNNKSFSNAIRS